MPKHVVFVANDQIVDVWENCNRVEVAENNIKTDKGLVMGYRGEFLVVDSTVNPYTTPVADLRTMDQKSEFEPIANRIQKLEKIYLDSLNSQTPRTVLEFTIKRLNMRITSLQDKVAELEARIARLEQGSNQ